MMILGLISSAGLCAADTFGQVASQQTASTQKKEASALLQALQSIRTDCLEPLTGAVQNGLKSALLSEIKNLSFLQRWAAEQRAKRVKKDD